MKPSTPRKVEAATESDIPHIVDIYYDAFPGERLRTVFPDTEEGRKWVTQAFKQCIGGASSVGGLETRTLVTRDPRGIAVAFALYRIWEAGSDLAARTWRARWPLADGYPDMKNEILDAFFSPTDKSRDFLLGDRAHIHLETLGVLPTHQKQGYGGALVKWGTELADELGIECYLNASPAGRPLYAASGYIDHDVSAVMESPTAGPMLRPAKSQRMGHYPEYAPGTCVL
ncbi:hypothetical protein DL766_007500 [Monosporascus sp. MC13-8B]|uniref:N-acetyltransferase domain-containing protein n=1 Tax=Monosporascus cannonballus TaxID=155416 RepID=A0ABY0H2E8_9PEZI|nr:hypothetical protein DL762_007390 [Monosporascus cannonballus]RYP23495.1 hypothetical protein DL766_007500 [Monosporascus sp. MC13-8B]